MIKLPWKRFQPVFLHMKGRREEMVVKFVILITGGRSSKNISALVKLDWDFYVGHIKKLAFRWTSFYAVRTCFVLSAVFWFDGFLSNRFVPVNFFSSVYRIVQWLFKSKKHFFTFFVSYRSSKVDNKSDYYNEEIF